MQDVVKGKRKRVMDSNGSFYNEYSWASVLSSITYSLYGTEIRFYYSIRVQALTNTYYHESITISIYLVCVIYNNGDHMFEFWIYFLDRICGICI